MLFSPKFGQTSLIIMRMDLVFFTRVPIIFSNLIFLVLRFQEVEKGYVPKFGVLIIFNLALVIKKWPH